MNESERKHTPLPWQWDKPLVHADLNRATIAHIRLTSETNSGGVLMAGAGVSYLVNDDDRTNGVLRAYIEVEPEDAEFIERACNNHYTLRDTLRDLTARATAQLPQGADTVGLTNCDSLAAARAALAAAE